MKGVIMMELSTHAKGLSTELAVRKAFIDNGFGVSIPLLPTSRYDMIADIDGYLFKVQIKTAQPIENSDGFLVKLKSSRTHRWGVCDVKYNSSEVDMFATYYNNNVYVIPQYMVDGMSSIHLRNTSANNQMVGVHYAENFRLDNVVSRWRYYQLHHIGCDTNILNFIE
jgi:hypothetical protein